jgi:Sulfatase
MIKRLILHPFAFAIFPILALLANNITEVDPRVALRSIIISLSATIFLILVFALISRSWHKAAITTTFILILFFSYGQVYELLKRTPIFGFSLGRHRYLVIIYAFILLIGLWWLIFKLKSISQTMYIMNIMGVVLLIYPLYLIINFTLSATSEQITAEEIITTSDTPLVSSLNPLPDVYYIVLDSHTRNDALKSDYDFDNSPYLDELKSMGFYIADCSRSNYGYTQGSMVAALNMDYLENLGQYMQGLNSDDIWGLLKQSRVRRALEAIGYKTVAFDTGYEWSRLTDANIYLSLGSDSYATQMINPFESMLIKSTAGIILTDSQNQLLRAGFKNINFPYSFHVNSQRFILDQLPKLASDPAPQFIFVHLLIPHPPFVFNADGGIVTDSAFYSGAKGGPIDETYLRLGYINEVQFIDQQMINIFKSILAQSATPPIVVIHGDHGLIDDNRLEILNAYYLPDQGNQNLYSTITPVNSFRIIFDTYFGTQYGLLPDLSYSQSETPAPETSPECIQK